MEEKSKWTSERIGTIVCIVLSVLLLPVFLINVTLAIKGLVNQEKPPSVFGVMPLAVTSGSMDNGEKGCIQVGDMIFVKEVDLDDLEVGDVITFHIGSDYITHRIIEISNGESGVAYFVTQGDANNTTDGYIYPDQVHGKYVGRVGNIGSVILFLQTPWGILLCVGLPLAAYAAFFAAGKISQRKQSRLAEKDAEIERLRALVVENLSEEGTAASLPPSQE